MSTNRFIQKCDCFQSHAKTSGKMSIADHIMSIFYEATFFGKFQPLLHRAILALTFLPCTYVDDVILMLLLLFFDMVLLCTSVRLMFIPHVKWYNVRRSKDFKYSTNRTIEQTVFREFSKNYKSAIFQTFLCMVTLS